MIAFEVFINGQRYCTAGAVGRGMVTANIHCFGDSLVPGDAFLAVGGLDSSSGRNYEWPQETLSVGSEVLIRIVDTDSVDAPPGD